MVTKTICLYYLDNKMVYNYTFFVHPDAMLDFTVRSRVNFVKFQKVFIFEVTFPCLIAPILRCLLTCRKIK